MAGQNVVVDFRIEFDFERANFLPRLGPAELPAHVNVDIAQTLTDDILELPSIYESVVFEQKGVP